MGYRWQHFILNHTPSTCRFSNQAESTPTTNERTLTPCFCFSQRAQDKGRKKWSEKGNFKVKCSEESGSERNQCSKDGNGRTCHKEGGRGEAQCPEASAVRSEFASLLCIRNGPSYERFLAALRKLSLRSFSVFWGSREEPWRGRTVWEHPNKQTGLIHRRRNQTLPGSSCLHPCHRTGARITMM